MKSCVGLGLLTTLEVLDPATGSVRTRSCHGKWLAWEGGARRFVICTTKRRAVGAKLPSSVTKAHLRFHRAGPRHVDVVDAPAPCGAMKQIGLVKALVYKVPRRLKSPGKNRFLWHHAFGDTGHNGGSDYPLKVMPALMRDAKGNLFIKRRPGNIFNVDTWIRA